MVARMTAGRGNYTHAHTTTMRRPPEESSPHGDNREKLRLRCLAEGGRHFAGRWVADGGWKLRTCVLPQLEFVFVCSRMMRCPSGNGVERDSDLCALTMAKRRCECVGRLHGLLDGGFIVAAFGWFQIVSACSILEIKFNCTSS